jgi:hypothetical protein
MRHTGEVDLLASGADRPSLRRRAVAVLGRRPPPWSVPALACAVVTTTAAAVLTLEPVAARVEQQQRDVELRAARAAEPDLAARPLGGTATRTGEAASGRLALEVRNGRQPLVLLSVTAQVPGVRFAPVTYRGGRAMGTDERIELRLGFAIPDCALVRRSGRLVLRVASQGRERELALSVVSDPLTGAARQLDLDVVLDACG